MRQVVVVSLVISASIALYATGCDGGGGGGGGGGTGGGASSSSSATTSSGSSSSSTSSSSSSSSGGPVTLTNNDASCAATAVSPAAGEETHLAAVRLTPLSYPVEITGVDYILRGGTENGIECENGLAHGVDLFVGSDVTPAATPQVHEHWDVPAQAPTTMDRTIHLDLVKPVTLQTGEHLFVAVKMAGAVPKVLCVGGCQGDAVEEDRNYWSNAGAPPYPWATLASFGIDINYRIDAVGVAK
jgi:hypothetical protein